MNWRACRVRAGNQSVMVVSVLCLWAGLVCARGATSGETPMGPRHELHAAGVVEETRLAARLREPVTRNDEDEEARPGYLRRAKVFLAAGDYRRALDACLFHLWEQPSVESYVYLTYVYHAIDGYMEHLAAQDRWVAVEHLFFNLAARGAEDLVDPPDVLARMAKEIMHGALQKQADVTAAMAARLDRESVNRLWKEQSAWRAARPDDWWAGAPDAWGW